MDGSVSIFGLFGGYGGSGCAVGVAHVGVRE